MPVSSIPEFKFQSDGSMDVESQGRALFNYAINHMTKTAMLGGFLPARSFIYRLIQPADISHAQILITLQVNSDSESLDGISSNDLLSWASPVLTQWALNKARVPVSQHKLFKVMAEPSMRFIIDSGIRI